MQKSHVITFIHICCVLGTLSTGQCSGKRLQQLTQTFAFSYTGPLENFRNISASVWKQLEIFNVLQWYSGWFSVRNTSFILRRGHELWLHISICQSAGTFELASNPTSVSDSYSPDQSRWVGEVSEPWAFVLTFLQPRQIVGFLWNMHTFYLLVNIFFQDSSHHCDYLPLLVHSSTDLICMPQEMEGIFRSWGFHTGRQLK